MAHSRMPSSAMGEKDAAGAFFNTQKPPAGCHDLASRRRFISAKNIFSSSWAASSAPRSFHGRDMHHSREECLSLRATSWHSATISRCARGEQPLAIASTAFATACGSPSDSLRTESSSVTQPQSKDASDTPNACAICASSSSEGGRSPRSSLPKCSWEIRSFSAACSCVIFEASRATRIFRPIVL